MNNYEANIKAALDQFEKVLRGQLERVEKINAAKDFDTLGIFFTHGAHMVVIAPQRPAVVGVQIRALAPAYVFARAAYAVVMVAYPKLLHAAIDCRFNHLFRLVLAAKRIVGVRV